MSPESLRVAEATDADLTAISVFFVEAWRQAGPDAPGFAGATEEVIAEIASPETIRTRIGGPDRRMYLAWTGEEVVGFAATKMLDDDTVELAGIVVLQETVGTGVGSRLLEAAVEACSEQGFTSMTLSTETTNERALRFYRSHGFAITGTSTESVEGTDVDVYDLARSL